MKNFKLFILAGAIIGLFACESQKKVSDVIFDKYNGQSGFSMIALPPNFIDKFVDEDASEQKELLNQVRDLRLMTFNDEVDGKDGSSVYQEVNKILKKRNFEEMMSINKDGSKVTVQIKQKKDVVREMHVLVKGADKFFIASLTGRIDLNSINKTMNEIDFDDFGSIKNFGEDFNFDGFNFDDFNIDF